MKAKTFTLFLLLVLSTSTFSLAQNYQGFRSDRVLSLQMQATNELFGLKVDSVKYETDSVFFFMPYPLTIDDYGCQKLSYASWVGRKMTLDAEGNHTFYNYANQAVVIKSQANLNEEWVAFQNEEIQVIAKAVEWTNESFLNQTDMVKTIEFQTKDLQGNPISNTINNQQIKLSENFGFVQVLSFYFFPNYVTSSGFFPIKQIKTFILQGLSNPKIGKVNLTHQDFHDYQPGDEIHTEEESYDVSLFFKNIKTITKILERNIIGNDIEYITYVKTLSTQYYHGNQPQITYSEGPSTLVALHDHWINFLPGEFYESSNNNFSGLGAKNEPRLKKYLVENNFTIWLDSCLTPQIYDGYTGPYFYIEGLGGPYYNREFGPIYNMSRTLRYYKIGEEESGTPLVITNLNETPPTASCRLIQQPGQGSFSVLLEHSHLPAQMRIISLSGQVIDKAELNALNCIYANPLKLKGIYLLEVMDQNRTLLREKVVLF